MKLADLIGFLRSTSLLTFCLKASPFGCTADVLSAVVAPPHGVAIFFYPAFSSGGGYGSRRSGNDAKRRKELKSALRFVQPECEIH